MITDPGGAFNVHPETAFKQWWDRFCDIGDPAYPPGHPYTRKEARRIYMLARRSCQINDGHPCTTCFIGARNIITTADEEPKSALVRVTGEGVLGQGLELDDNMEAEDLEGEGE